MNKKIKYIIEEYDYDPWTSHGYTGLNSRKELTHWAKDGSIKEGDKIYKVIPILVMKDSKLKKL